MTEPKRTLIMRAPMTFNLGDAPADMRSHSQLFTYALAHIVRTMKQHGIPVKIDGETAIASYDAGDGLTSHTNLGARLDDRHYRVQGGESGHVLEVSDDRGATYRAVGEFGDRPFAVAVGEAWVDGRAEPAA